MLQKEGNPEVIFMKLTIKQRLLTAFTLFGMFFGAGNLIFPVHLGQLAGRNAWQAIIGFCITAVGIPILGVAAIGITHSDGLQSLASKVGKKYGLIFTAILYLTIGPFFAIPRCATTSFTTGIAPMISGNEQIALFLFSLIFFALTLIFSLKPGKITVWIGKIINPIFLVFLAILVFTAIFRPTATIAEVAPAAGYENKALFSSLIEGYGTMDAIAGLAFGIVVINIIRDMGVTEDEAIAGDVLRSGILTGILMAVIYILTIIIGTQSRGVFETSENGGIALAQISEYYLGTFGKLVLAVTITFACLKTSIGLVTSCSEAFLRMFPGKLTYRTWAIVFSVFSFAVSNVGLSAIINYSLPVLMFLYPLAITLILLALFGKFFHHDRRVYVCVTALTLFAALFDFLKTLPEGLSASLHLEGVVNFGRTILPFFDLNLGWVVPAAAGLFIGLLLRKKNQ